MSDMEIKYNFFFGYIFYRMTAAYHKWDGRNGITSLIGISMIQGCILLDIVFFLLRLFFEREQLHAHLPLARWIILVTYGLILVFNYRKYDNTYNKFRFYCKDESKSKRRIKGILVVVSLIVPWLPIILMGIYWK